MFIHGWTANRHRWDDQVGHFAGRYRVISLDLRGHGDSDRTPDLYTIRGLAREVLALLDGLGVDRFVACGALDGRDDRPHACPGASENAWNAWWSSTL